MIYWRQMVLSGLILSSISAPLFATSHHPQDFLNSIAGKKEEGRLIVAHYCATCHAENPLISIGAPRIGIKSDWSMRLKQGWEILFQHTDEGYHAMPARGGCFECTDHQLELAIMELLAVSEREKLSP